ncbi:hypothetical protein, partial [Boseongicola aestuarii]|uniref:hypothetical protein n=1 Tax=Boseongicola aestuarii TaxID=1470561 RepID=UPI001C3D3B95
SRQLQLNLTQQLQYIFVRMPFPCHSIFPSQDQCSGPVLGGKDNIICANPMYEGIPERTLGVRQGIELV